MCRIERCPCERHLLLAALARVSVGGRDGTEVKPYVAPTREAQIKALKEEVFDVLVIGGGCVGSGGELGFA